MPIFHVVGADQSEDGRGELEMYVSAGNDIDSAIANAISHANQYQTSVVFEFNGVHLTVNPGDTNGPIYDKWREECDAMSVAYYASDEYKKYEAERKVEVAKKQRIVNRCINRLPKVLRNEPVLMSCLCKLAENADDVNVIFDKQAVKAVLETVWAENAYVTPKGASPEQERLAQEALRPNTPEGKSRLCAYIVGQVINCLGIGMPPHPITVSFIEQYKKGK